MTTPADWYPDPEDPSGLRYWDGTSWTEHRAPAPVAAEAAPVAETPAEPPATQADEFPASEQATTVVPTRPAVDPAGSSELDPAQGGSHRVPDATEEASAPPSSSSTEYSATPSQPYDTHPPTSYEPPAPESTPWDAPLPSWDAPPAGQSYTPPPTQPTQSYEAAPFAPPPGPPGPPVPPYGPSGGGPNKKLVFGILGGAAVILLALVLIVVFVVIRHDEPTVTSLGTSSSKSSTTSSETTSESSSETSSDESPTPTPPATPSEGSDGDYTFSVAGTETGDTITSTVSDAVQKTATGMFYVVYVNVTNTGTSPLTFVATFQKLAAAGETFALDDEATAFLGGTIATVAPGDKVETPLVYDVPVGTAPDTVQLRADPVSPGVELPLQ
jgi:hypothetical protein